MFGPRELFTAVDDTFQRGARQTLCNYLLGHPGMRKWIIAADYCMGDPSRHSNAFVFTLHPYDDWFLNSESSITNALSRDLKAARAVPPGGLSLLRHPHRLHVCFVTAKDLRLFADSAVLAEVTNVRAYIAAWAYHFRERERDPRDIAKVEALLQKSKANRFNLSLFKALYLTHFFFAYVTLALCRDSSPEIIGWFSDRDSMTSWCDGVLWPLTGETLHGLAEEHAINTRTTRYSIGVPGVHASYKRMWYDHLTRIPDYIAGTLAAWDFQNNHLPGHHPKFVQMARDVMADNANVIVFKLSIGSQGLGCSRIQILSKQPPENNLMAGRTEF